MAPRRLPARRPAVAALGRRLGRRGRARGPTGAPVRPRRRRAPRGDGGGHGLHTERGDDGRRDDAGGGRDGAEVRRDALVDGEQRAVDEDAVEQGAQRAGREGVCANAKHLR